jgi:hypothetical protein
MDWSALLDEKSPRLNEHTGRMVRVEGLEPSLSLRKNGFSCPLRLSPPLHVRRVWGLDSRRALKFLA